MVRIQVWRPDTCGCVIHQRVNDDGTVTAITAEEAEQIAAAISGGTARPQPAAVMCEHHAAHQDVESCCATVTDENRRKNLTFKALEEAGVSYDQYVWEFTPDRARLDVRVVGRTLTPRQRTDLAVALEAAHGPGKVRLT